MNTFTHILSVLVLGKYLDLSFYEFVLAFIFGVLVDIDHLLKIPIFIKLKNFRTIRHLNWRTPLQEPISYLWVVPLSIFIGSYVPVVFLSLHLVLDYMTSFQKKPFFPFSNFKIKNTKRYTRDIVSQVVVSLICIILYLI
tara:strand:- start:85 stop:504 length:420 start_codon:yes stop_codon:yes gene_type:complete